MAVSQRRSLRLIISNLWHNWPSYRGVCERTRQIVALAKEHEADVLLLQEVARTPDCTAAKFIAERLNADHAVAYFSGAIEDETKPAEGVAVVSRYPIVQSKPYTGGWAFPIVPYFTLDTGLAARIKLPWAEMWFVSIHMGFRGLANTKSVEELAEWVDTLGGEESVIIGGDFNMPAGGKPARYAASLWRDLFLENGSAAEEPPITHRIRYPISLPVQNRLDYLFLRSGHPDWKVRDAKVLKVEEAGFDHYPVWYELEIAQHPKGEKKQKEH